MYKEWYLVWEGGRGGGEEGKEGEEEEEEGKEEENRIKFVEKE